MLVVAANDTQPLSVAAIVGDELVCALNRLLVQEKASSLTRGRFRFHS
jgi:hypothetical protein